MLGFAEGGGLAGFGGVVGEGQFAGEGFENEIEGVGVELLDLQAAFDEHLGGGLREVDQGDGVVEDVVNPAEAVCGLDVEGGFADLDVVTLQGPEQQPVGPELDGLGVTVPGEMTDMEPHGGARGRTAGYGRVRGAQHGISRRGGRAPPRRGSGRGPL